MTEKPARFNILLYLSLFIIILFITSHLWGGNIFENDWSFIHWQQIPLWYLMILVFLLTVGSFVIIKKKNLFDNAFDSSSKLYSGQIILLIILIFFQFDSFLYGGGNHLINQIAQTETIIYRWFEFGSILIVSIFYKLFSLFNIHHNFAGYLSWKIFSFSGAIL
ncbi:MAG: hypothetical protein ACE5D6_02500, partial [Candidatus Zixiibacteriota bacterium]